MHVFVLVRLIFLSILRMISISILLRTSSNQRLGKCVRQKVRTRKRGTRQRGPKPLKKPGGAANLQSSHDEISKFHAVHRDRNEIRMRSRSSNAISIQLVSWTAFYFLNVSGHG